MASFNGNVVGGSLNLRSTASSGGTRLTSIPDGASLVVSTVSGNTEWFSTSYGGYSGFVMARYVGIASDGGTCTVTTASGSLNVRVTPTSGASVVYTAAQYSTLRLLDYTSQTGWYRVSSASGTGWSQSQFLTITSYPGGSSGGEDPIPAPYTLLTATMQMGSTGSQVEALQDRLNQLRYYCGPADGTFGKDTEWAVEYFQSKHGLTVDGIVGANTRTKLNASGSNSGTQWGVPQDIRNWTTGYTPQQWFMNGSAQIWRNEPFDANQTSTVETIGDSGNAPTSFAMIASTFRGTAITPPIVCKFVMDEGYRDHSGNTGVTSGFFSNAAAEYDLSYQSTVSTISQIQNQLSYGRLALIRVVGDAAHGYCSANGATYLVIYKIANNVVYVLNPNYNTQSQGNLSTSAWTNGNWMREAHIYGP